MGLSYSRSGRTDRNVCATISFLSKASDGGLVGFFFLEQQEGEGIASAAVVAAVAAHRSLAHGLPALLQQCGQIVHLAFVAAAQEGFIGPEGGFAGQIVAVAVAVGVALTVTVAVAVAVGVGVVAPQGVAVDGGVGETLGVGPGVPTAAAISTRPQP